MNRNQRRGLTKGDSQQRLNKIQDAEEFFQKRISAVNQREKMINVLIVDKGKEFASDIIQNKLMVLIKETLKEDVKLTDKKIELFEEKFNEKFKTAVSEMGKEEEAEVAEAKTVKESN